MTFLIIAIITFASFKTNSCDASPAMVSTMDSFDISQNNISNDEAFKLFDYTFRRISHSKKKRSKTNRIETPVIFNHEKSIYSTFLNRFNHTGKRTIVSLVKPIVDGSDGSFVFKSLKQMENDDDRQRINYRMFERY